LFELVPLAAYHDAVPVTVGLGAGNDLGDELWGEAADTLEQIADLLVFDAELGFVGEVLVLAAATFAEVTAPMLDAGGRGSHDAQQAGASESLFELRDLSLNDITGGDERDEHDKLIEAGDAFAAEGDILDGQGDFIIWGQTHREEGRGRGSERKGETRESRKAKS
jgi:hypothetical protein